MNISKFNNFILSHGYNLPNNFNYNLGINLLLRFADTNKNNQNKNLWIKNINNNIYVFGDWSTGLKINYIDDINQNIESSQYNYIEMQKAQIEKEEMQKIKSENLHILYDMLPLADTNHPYLIKKNISNHELIRQKDNMLVIPCYCFKGKIQTIQYIFNDGSKRFANGAKFKGSWLPLNKSSCKSFIFCEGFATGMSIMREIIKNKIDVTVIVCFNSSNIINIVKFIDYQFNDAELNIYADNDLNEVGLTYAKKVQQCIPRVKISLPPLTEGQKKAGLSDFNDYINYKK